MVTISKWNEMSNVFKLKLELLSLPKKKKNLELLESLFAKTFFSQVARNFTIKLNKCDD
jgi:hypothetical protein